MSQGGISKSKIFFYFCIAFICGIALASFLPQEILHYDIWLFGVCVALAVAAGLFKNFLKVRPRGFAFFVCTIFFIFGVWRYAVALPPDGVDKIWHYNDQTITLTGRINKEPDVRIANQKLTVAVYAITDERRNVSLPVSGNVLVTVDLYPEHSYGDTLQMKCNLQAPEAFDEFAYDRYLARYAIYSVCYYPRVFAVAPLSQTSPTGLPAIVRLGYAQLLRFKARLNSVAAGGLPEPESALLQSILFNNRSGLTPELMDAFSQTGVTHIIAISGSHLSFIAAVAMVILLHIGLNRRQSLLLSLLIVMGYIVLVGAPASALRAGVMAALAVAAFYAGRLHQAARILVFSVAVLVAVNPFILRDDIGFQLSVAAVASIIYLYPIIESWLEKLRVPERFGLRAAFSLTVGAQIFTAPIVMYNFHQLSLIAPIANVLAFIAVMPIMILGIAGVAAGAMFADFAWLFLAPAYGFLKYFIWLSYTLARLPLAFVSVENLWSGWAALYYIIIVGSIVWYNRRERNENVKK
jgi:competence protein ComEC